MLTSRNVLLAVISVAVLSVVCGTISLFWGGETRSPVGRNSYGTRTEGYRAFYDLLSALKFKVDRIYIPSKTENTLTTSYVLWNPQDRLIQIEPVYLEVLSEWVKEGGYLVVTPSVATQSTDKSVCRCCSSINCSSCTPRSLLNEIGLAGVSFEQIKLKSISGSDKYATEYDNTDIRTEDILDIFKIKKRPTEKYLISHEGEWKHLNSQASQVELPSDLAWGIQHGELEPSAKIVVDDLQDNAPITLAALFPLGKGQVVLISNPYLASNASLAEADNSVLLTNLVTGRRPTVLFDEFYHGLTVRGNALWLLSKRPYAVTAISLFIVVSLWVWRHAIFLGPSRQETTTSRRSLGEYIEAMSRFLLKGDGSPRYILDQVRSGVLWHYSKTLGLPPQQQDVEIVLGLLSKRMPQKATQLESALKYADAIMKNPQAPQEEILIATRKVSDCLSI